MKTTIRRTAAAMTAAVTAIALLPQYAAFADVMYSSLPWQQNQYEGQKYSGDYIYYEYESGKQYSNEVDLGYIVMPACMDVGAGGNNELGLLPIDSGDLIVDENGRISAKEVGSYQLVAKLKDGYAWPWNTTEDVYFNFVICPINLGTPEYVQDTLPYVKGVSQSPKLKTDISAYCTAEGDLSADEPGTYSITYRVKDEYADHYHLNYDSYVELEYTIADCTHQRPDGTSYLVNGCCTNCGGFSEPVLIDNGTEDPSDDYYEISNYGELCWYLENKRQLDSETFKEYDYNAKLTANIAVDGQPLPERDLKNAVFDGQGYVISGLKGQPLFTEIRFDSTICNLGLTDSGGAIVQTNKGTISCCFVEGEYLVSFNGCSEYSTDEYDTEVVGKISNCYCVGNGSFGAICETQYENGSIENCYYNPTSDHKGAYSVEKFNESTGFYEQVPVTEEDDSELTAFDRSDAVSGALGAKMNELLSEEIWFQNIDNGEEPDVFPVASSEHGEIYLVDECAGSGKAGSNDSTRTSTHVGQALDGICDVCGAYKEPEVVDGVYQLKNPGNLLSYAKMLNAADDDTGMDAVLCNDIVINESLLDESGTVVNTDPMKWIPMNAKNITFDGQNHSISGLYIKNASGSQEPSGLFGTVDGCAINNLLVEDSYVQNDANTGGIAGKTMNTSIKDCGYFGMLYGSDYETIGAIAGAFDSDYSIMTNCLNIKPAEDSAKELFGSSDSMASGMGGLIVIGFDDSTLATGEITKDLGGSWGQQLGTDKYPKLGAMPVYYIEFTADRKKLSVPDGVYSNSDAAAVNAVLMGLDPTYQYEITNGTTGEVLSVPLEKISPCSVTIEIIYPSIQLDTGKKTSYSVKYGKSITNISLAEYVKNAAEVGGVTFRLDPAADYGLSLSDSMLKGTPNLVGEFELDFTITAGNGETESLKLTFTSAKGTATSPTTPKAASVEYGQTLADAALSDSAWKWADSTIVPSVNNEQYLAYLDVDDENYDYSNINGYNAATGRIERKITVNVTNNHVILDKASVTLNGDIGMNFYLIIPSDIADDATVTINDAEYDAASAKQSDGSYKFTYWVNAKEMHDELKLTVLNASGAQISLYNNKGEYKGTSNTSCVADYLDSIKDRTDALGELARNMLKYGESAQLHFDYNTDVMSTWTDAQNTAYQSKADALTADDFAAFAATITGDLPDGLTLRSMSLLLMTETTARMNFETKNAISGYAFKLDGEAVKPKKFTNTNEYAVDLFNIAAKDLDAQHTITVGGCTISYSALSYANAVYNNPPSDTLLNTAKALYLYWDAAETYFASAH
ncbi:MAG: hypothetical protein MJ065_06730 [Oscillospiraceae bacterium]|nr:hypothetical protein [Oscillospiraceae bacterium]